MIVVTDRYEINADEDGYEYIQCVTCGFKSYNRGDIDNHYCGKCHVFHDDETEKPREIYGACLLADW